MAKGLHIAQRIEVGLSVRVDPKVVLNSHVLQLSAVELEQAIEIELSENPALDRIDDQEPIDENDILRAIAPQEFLASGDCWEAARGLSDGGETTWLELACSNTTLSQHLMASLLPSLPSNLRHVGAWAIFALNPHGYLEASDEEIALANNCSLEEAHFVVRKLQTCEPHGVGGRDVKECLLLQLRGESVSSRLARVIVRCHLDLFSNRQTSKLSRKYHVTGAVVEEAFELIAALNPYPADGFEGSSVQGSVNRSVTITPDLIISRTEQAWQVEVLGANAGQLQVERFYAKRLSELTDGPSRPLAPDSAKVELRQEIRHLSTYVQRANDFIDSLSQRRQTLMQIGAYLVDRQSSFLSTGDYAFLSALTRSQVATAVGLHESTVSRALAGKFVQIPSGEVISFEVFFKPALRVQKMIEELLQMENPENPLSDERIAALLAERGVHVARRTVNKYRDRNRLLSSRRRKVA